MIEINPIASDITSMADVHWNTTAAEGLPKVGSSTREHLNHRMPSAVDDLVAHGRALAGLDQKSIEHNLSMMNVSLPFRRQVAPAYRIRSESVGTNCSLHASAMFKLVWIG